MKQKLTEVWNKIKSNKGKLGAAAIASAIGVGVFDINPTITNGISKARNEVARVIKKEISKPKKTLKEIEDTEGDVRGASVWVDGERYRVIISKSDLIKLLSLQEDEENTIEFYDEESPVKVDNESSGEYWIRVHCSQLVDEFEKEQCVKRFRKI